MRRARLCHVAALIVASLSCCTRAMALTAAVPQPGTGVASPDEWSEVPCETSIWLRLDGWDEKSSLTLLPDRPQLPDGVDKVAVGLRSDGALVRISHEEALPSPGGARVSPVYRLTPVEPLRPGVEVSVVTVAVSRNVYGERGAVEERVLARFRTARDPTRVARVWDGTLRAQVREQPIGMAGPKSVERGPVLTASLDYSAPPMLAVWKVGPPSVLDGFKGDPGPPDELWFVSGLTKGVRYASAGAGPVSLRLQAIGFDGKLGRTVRIDDAFSEPTVRPNRDLRLAALAVGALLMLAALWRLRIARATAPG